MSQLDWWRNKDRLHEAFTKGLTYLPTYLHSCCQGAHISTLFCCPAILPRGLHWRCPLWPTCHVSTCRLGWSLDSLPFQQHSTAGASPYRQLIPTFQVTRSVLIPSASRINKSLPNSSQHHLSTGFFVWGLSGSRKDSIRHLLRWGFQCQSWKNEFPENHPRIRELCAGIWRVCIFILCSCLIFLDVIVVSSILLKWNGWVSFLVCSWALHLGCYNHDHSGTETVEITLSSNLLLLAGIDWGCAILGGFLVELITTWISSSSKRSYFRMWYCRESTSEGGFSIFCILGFKNLLET